MGYPQYFPQSREAVFILDVYKNVARNVEISSKSIT